MNDGVKPFNEGLAAQVEQRVDWQRADLQKAQHALSALGIPVVNPNSAPRTYSAPEVNRRPAPPLPNGGRTQPLEPTLAQQHYEHILEVMQSFAMVMERSPAAFVGMGRNTSATTCLST